ncbi:signal recognition particle protein [Hydrogenobacter thermophilus TK-6]|uniref:Signal recognition particle protein n=1 Tax=Hydrogenobacter thermophilus (strain DSM 6534 / IAM 12695 / TK-6) TaxID=608538 RepID=D3DFT6_HYDTT|nr:signal recognition particle protein [Hydrogenobacter thermophilus]ADO44628.1 signal recognition particle protein [Hydrogenobacter thermophilus TK-6]BAI68688.1 signal recognition particle GTPase [Hydrogenobacter thermophilus TK-6]
MLDLLTERFSKSLSKLRGVRKLTEKQVNDILRDIRMALLEADVDYDVVKSFLKKVRDRAINEDIKNKLSPADSVVLTVYEELTSILGGEKADLKRGVVIFVGLQGTGKTTTIGKLANFLKNQSFKVAVSSTDVRRPAAMLQLQRLAEKVGVPYYSFDEASPVEIATKALERAKKEGVDYLLIDTAGRLHIDEELMEELKRIKEAVKPSEVIYVADAMQGQEALRALKAFHESITLTGVILTKMDGDARGGVALSVKEAIGVPIKFVGVGEKLEDIEIFYPDRIAQRILGLGDLQSLIEKAQQIIPEDEAQVLATRIMMGEFDLEDMLKQIRFIKSMGPLEKILGMIPGVSAELKNLKIDEKKFKKTEAIILSMTKEERRNPKIINMSRKVRIAKGSGTSVGDVNKVLKEYEEMKKMIKRLKGMQGIPKLPRFPFKF